MDKVISWCWIILVLPFFGMAQKNITDAQGKKQGEWVKFHESSKVPIYVGQFKDDVPVGKFTYYYPSNKIKAIVNHDPKTGRSESFMYHENKKLMAHGIYMNQQKDSVWTHYGPSGRISFKETYKNGELHGTKTVYYVPEILEDRSVTVMSESMFEHGRLNGPTREYFPDGVLKLEGTYKEGKFEGVVKRYHPNGKMHQLERWKDRRKHGWWIAFDMNGKEIARKYYHMGNPVEGERLEKHMARLKAAGISPNE